MNKSNTTIENQLVFKNPSWKTILGFMAFSILLNIAFAVIELTHFNTFNGAPFAERLSNLTMFVGNWPSFLLRKYPYVIAGGGEIVYEVFGWMNPIAFIINMVGWGLIGFIASSVIRKRRC